MDPRLVYACMLLLSSIVAPPSHAAAQRSDALTTVAEQSRFLRTGRYEEVERLCAAYEKAWPTKVRCFEFGRSPEGRRMLALAASADGTLDAASAQRKQRPVALMQGGIHAGEIDGKDAGFLALRELIEGRAANGALSRVTFVFVPVFSVDGHERFGRWNRPNQVGPEEMGWRTTAQNLNLNRDYTKADAPEMQAMLRLLNEWDPILYVDLHVTDGAEFQHDISINVAPTQAGDTDLVKAGIALRDEMIRKLAAQGSLPLNFYPAFVRDDDPQSGIDATVSPARFSQAYWSVRNRFGVLVETHSWKDYATRVRITRNAIVDMIELTAAQGESWIAAAKAADRRSTRIGGSSMPLAYVNDDQVTQIDFLGYEYTREPSAISGGLVTHYNNKRPQTWRIPLRDTVKPSVSEIAPRGGYIVPAAYAGWMSEKFKLHGIESRLVAAAVSKVDVETFRASKVSLAATTFEGRTPATVEGAWRAEARDIPAGSLFVPIAQPRAALVMALLEPKGPDSFLSWGFFNAVFERKEYMEAYVAEQVAADMLKKDPALKKEFERKLATEPAFAQSPSDRLEFFHARHSSWDERLNLYPVYRVQSVVQ